MMMFLFSYHAMQILQINGVWHCDVTFADTKSPIFNHENK